MDFEAQGKKIRIFLPDKKEEALPVVVTVSYEDEGRELYETCRQIGCDGLILVSVYGIDWNGDLSPWKAKAPFKGSGDFGGKADLFLETLTKDIIPEADELIIKAGYAIDSHAIAGYSLAGLFSLYSIYNTDAFQAAASVSGSLWYPGFGPYYEEHALSRNIKRIYLSLGDREAKTRNEVMASVERETLAYFDHYRDRVDIFFEFNEGNHFREPLLRMAKGIRYLIG